MKNVLITLLISFPIFTQAQTEVQAKGVFAEIDVKAQNETVDAINSESKKDKKQAIQKVMDNPNNYNPPVVYALSHELFEKGKKDEACYWFYLAQLRARYDANLCKDKSAVQAVGILNNQYGPEINKYAFQDIDKLEETIIQVVNYVRINEENYDHRWINLHGMWAIQASMGNSDEQRALSMPKDEWPDIKKETVDGYYNGFIEYVKKQKK